MHRRFKYLNSVVRVGVCSAQTPLKRCNNREDQQVKSWNVCSSSTGHRYLFDDKQQIEWTDVVCLLVKMLGEVVNPEANVYTAEECDICRPDSNADQSHDTEGDYIALKKWELGFLRVRA